MGGSLDAAVSAAVRNAAESSSLGMWMMFMPMAVPFILTIALLSGDELVQERGFAALGRHAYVDPLHTSDLGRDLLPDRGFRLVGLRN